MGRGSDHLHRLGGFTQLVDTMDLAEQELLIGLPPELVEEIGKLGLRAPLSDGASTSSSVERHRPPYSSCKAAW